MYRHSRLLVYTLLASLALAGAGCKGPLVVDGEGPVTPPPAAAAGENAALQPRKNLLEVGDAVPPFVLADQKGRLVAAAELTAASGAVLVFLPADDNPAGRSAWDWIRRSRKLLDSRSLELLVVTPGSPPLNEAIAAREDLRMAFLSDPGSWVAAAFGASPAVGAPPEAPFVFVLGSNNRIQLASRGLPPGTDLVFAAESMQGVERDNFFFSP